MFLYDVISKWCLFGTMILLRDHRSVIGYNDAATVKFILEARWLFANSK